MRSSVFIDKDSKTAPHGWAPCLACKYLTRFAVTNDKRTSLQQCSLATAVNYFTMETVECWTNASQTSRMEFFFKMAIDKWSRCFVKTFHYRFQVQVESSLTGLIFISMAPHVQLGGWRVSLWEGEREKKRVWSMRRCMWAPFSDLVVLDLLYILCVSVYVCGCGCVYK